jgi:hypothetical protein
LRFKKKNKKNKQSWDKPGGFVSIVYPYLAIYIYYTLEMEDAFFFFFFFLVKEKGKTWLA